MFETAVGKIGVYICYDRHFPEGARTLGLQGAEIVLYPHGNGWVRFKGFVAHRGPSSLLLQNSYYVGAVNRVGLEDGFGPNEFYGLSYFSDPRGQVIGEMGSEYSDDLIIRDLDLARNKESRDCHGYYQNRRPELYRESDNASGVKSVEIRA